MCLAFDQVIKEMRLNNVDPEHFRFVVEILTEYAKAKRDIMTPFYNIRPTDSMVTVLNLAKPEIKVARFGLAPQWITDPKTLRNLNNARAETVFERPAYREAAKKRRCLIPATGFYEWPAYSKGEEKLPYRITMRSEETFFIAGIWEPWTNSEFTGYSAAIITTEPNEMIAPYHDRMPVIIGSNDVAEWLNPELVTSDEISQLFKPYPANEMKQYLVSTLVNKPRNKSSEITLPASQPK